MTVAAWTIVIGNTTTSGAAATAPAAWATALDVVDQLVDTGAVDPITVTVAGEPLLIAPGLDEHGVPNPEETRRLVQDVRDILVPA